MCGRVFGRRRSVFGGRVRKYSVHASFVSGPVTGCPLHCGTANEGRLSHGNDLTKPTARRAACRRRGSQPHRGTRTRRRDFARRRQRQCDPTGHTVEAGAERAHAAASAAVAIGARDRGGRCAAGYPTGDPAGLSDSDQPRRLRHPGRHHDYRRFLDRHHRAGHRPFARHDHPGGAVAGGGDQHVEPVRRRQRGAAPRWTCAASALPGRRIR